METIIFGIFISVCIFLIIFLLCRELFCWYLKINQRIKLLQEIRDLLRCNIPEEKTKEIEKQYKP